MNVLIVGSGGREYSIGRAFSQDSAVKNIYFAPGNGATEDFGQNVAIEDFEQLADFAQQKAIELTVVGPEAPLVAGIVDVFEKRGLTIFGPRAKAAQLEGSKIFMKNFLQRHNIPTARYIQTSEYEKACVFIDDLEAPIVVKADGLCGGKGVIIAQSHEEAKAAAKDMLRGESFGDAGTAIVVEEFLDGYELSMFAICDGKDFVLLPAAQDHKRLLNNDAGPNTGGMGAYAPTPLIDARLKKQVEDRVVTPTLEGMIAEDNPFKGVLFIGLMIVGSEAKVLEYNVRFGDPECEVLLPLLKTPASEFFMAAASGKLHDLEVVMSEQKAVGVVMASKDYPYKSSTPAQIIVDDIVDTQLAQNSYIAYAGVKKEDDTLLASGGRVLVCVGFGDSVKEARDRAYALCGQVHFEGKQCRTDIAYQAIE
ncbi:MAG: phosphoribosylamine--glycine ligase [Campylobacterota bacterium]